MSLYDVMIGREERGSAALDIDLVRSEVVFVQPNGREMRLNRDQAHQLALGMIKAVNIIDRNNLRLRGGR